MQEEKNDTNPAESPEHIKRSSDSYDELKAGMASAAAAFGRFRESVARGMRILFADEEKGDFNLMKYFIGLLSLILFFALTMVGYVSVKESKMEVKPVIMEASEQCIDCHVRKGISAGAVRDWKMSAHAAKGIGCNECHIPAKGAPERIVAMPTACEDPNVRREVSSRNCKQCHSDKVAEFMKGKHSKAWLAMEAMPTTKDQPDAIMAGEKGCGACHKIGRDEGQCDSCHTRHLFSAAEARRPEACGTCHMGFDHPQWEMYSTSKHGMIYQTEKNDYDFSRKIGDWYKEPFEASSKTPRAPVCVTCHMQDGGHDVSTAWGFLALRLPEEDEEWMGYRVRILQGLGVLDANGKPTERLGAVKAAQMARLTREEWEAERRKMLNVCSQCHGETWAREELEKIDGLIKEADRLMAEAVDIVEGLYRDGILPRPADYPAGVDLLRFYEVQSGIEQTLYVMFLEHRMRTFQGGFHSNPDYLHWYGWAEMKRDLVEIREEARRLREEHKGG